MNRKILALCDKDNRYTCRLQEYAENVLHVDGGFESRKKELFAGAVCRCLLRPDKENFNCVIGGGVLNWKQ